MDKPIIVFAGDYRQYQWWLKQSGHTLREARYIGEGSTAFYGYRPDDVEVVLVGEYWRNEACEKARDYGLLKNARHEELR